ncbi:sugar phosphate nucleotidyltransferase [Verrucomicrobiota bacterium]
MNRCAGATQAVLLVGGKGTRLSGLHPDCPKALVPVAGRPFLEWQLAWLRQGGVRRIHLAAGHLASELEEWLSKDLCPGMDFTISVEPACLGTGGGLRFAESYVLTDPFLVLNGDSLLPELSFADLVEHHRSGAVSATVAVTRIRDAGRYGTVEFDGTGHITAFREKAERTGGWVNGGVYVVTRTVLSGIEVGGSVSLETDVFPALARGGAIRAFAVGPPLLDMGTPEGIRVMEEYLGTANPEK